MRELITIQKNNKLNNVYAADKKGDGGVNHLYLIFFNKPDIDSDAEHSALIQFRNGSDSESGIIDTDLLEIVRDRLIGFQQGKYASRETAIALTHIETALMWLNKQVEDDSVKRSS